jgi:calcineurin-like phosphoesterase family protein
VSSTWYSSDSHFLHKFVASIRGFAGAEEHDEAIIANWNSVVAPGDLVWHLGDVGLGNETRVLEQVARLNGRKQLITGNHDLCWPGHRDSRKHQRRWLEVFESVQAFAKIRLDSRMVLLSHFPYEGDHVGEDRATQYRLRDEGAWLLHGHTHLPNRLGPHPHYLTTFSESVPRGREVHIGLDAWNLAPVGDAAVLGVIQEHEASMAVLGAAEIKERLAELRGRR